MAAPDSPDAQLDDLGEDLRGDLFRPVDPGYDDARAVWNGMIDRRPALIAQCHGVHDVIDALGFASAHNLAVSIRGGGHNVAGTAMCDDGLVIDLSGMTAVRVDPSARTAWVEAGATWADVDRETQAFGLAAPGGVVSETGVAGLTLGGGIGHLRCAYGLSCDNLRTVELVTAAGEHCVASESRNPELFWGLRGGSGTLGVVTGFEFDLQPVGPEVATCLVFYPGDHLRECLAAYREFVEAAPDAASTLVFSGIMPDGDLFPAEAIDEPKVGILGCYAGPVDEGAAAFEPLRSFMEPLADFSGSMPYVELQRLLDEDYPDGMRYYWKSLYLDDLTDPAIDRIRYWVDAAPSPLSTVDVWELGGAIAAVDPSETAFVGRHAPYLLGVEANWEDPANDDANVAWVRDCLDDMRQFSDGAVYLNFPGFVEERDDVLAATFGATQDRLTALRDEYDPSGLFDLNRDRAGARSASDPAPTE